MGVARAARHALLHAAGRGDDTPGRRELIRWVSNLVRAGDQRVARPLGPGSVLA